MTTFVRAVDKLEACGEVCATLFAPLPVRSVLPICHYCALAHHGLLHDSAIRLAILRANHECHDSYLRPPFLRTLCITTCIFKCNARVSDLCRSLHWDICHRRRATGEGIEHPSLSINPCVLRWNFLALAHVSIAVNARKSTASALVRVYLFRKERNVICEPPTGWFVPRQT